MASCDDDFALLGDESQSHHHLPQQQQQASAAFSSHRYIPKASVSIHSHSIHLNAINSKKEPAGSVTVDDDHEGYGGEAFAQPDHCFADDDPGSNPFDPSQPPEDEDVERDDNHGNKSHAHLQQQQQHHASRADSKRRDRDELSDGESPYGYNMGSKRSRPALMAPSPSGDYRKDREEWSDSAIGCLLDAYTEKYIQLNRGNLRGRDWEDVATTVSERCDKQKSGKTVEQCKNKVDNLKKRYKVECQRLSSGNLAVSHWPWFKKMEQIVGSSSSSKVVSEEEKTAALGDANAPTSRLLKSMMASAMNAILLQATFEKIGIETRVQTAIVMQEVAEPYIRRRAIRHLEKGRVVIFGGIGAGTGNPLFTTDTVAALRASEINADAVLKGTTTDGVYDCHSRNNGAAFEHISFRELVSRGFTAMDMTAVTFCEENNIPVVLFNLMEPSNISRALCGDQVGTLIDQSGRIV